MRESIQVTAVETDVISGLPCWMVHQTRGDGSTHLHVFPTDTLAWRATEYGIDPADTETLLDLVLHEPHMQPLPVGPDHFSVDARKARLREAKKAVSITSATGQPDPLDRIRNRPVGPDVQRIRQALHARNSAPRER